MADVELSESVKGPWRHIQDWDVALMGEQITEPEEQSRWALAMSIAGGLPYMWRILARPVCDIVYGLLELREGDRVLIIGEGVEPAGWAGDMREVVGPSGVVDTTEIFFQDLVAQAGQGPIADRNKERLGQGDKGVILLRQLWSAELRRVAEGTPVRDWRSPTEGPVLYYKVRTSEEVADLLGSPFVAELQSSSAD